MRDSQLKKIGTIAISLLLLAYVGYQVYKSTFTGVKTETAEMFLVADTISATGIVLREETVITSDLGSAIKFTNQECEKVPKGGTVAQVYAKMEDVSAQEEIDLLNDEINHLEALSKKGNSYEMNQEDIDGKITEQFIAALDEIHNEDLSTFHATRNRLLDVLNERQVATGVMTDFSQRLSVLKQQREQLQTSHSAAIGTLTAPVAGYFIQKADGYENAFDLSSLSSITISDLQNFESKRQQIPSNAVCKISSGHEWYIACVVSASDVLKLEKGNSVNLVLPSVSTATLPVIVKEINQADKTSDAVVIFQCDVLDSDLISVRSTEVEIQTKQYSGIRINRSALRMETLTREIKDEDGNVVGTEEKEVQGVYILYGEEIQFREIVPLYTDNQFVICDANPSDSFSGNVLQLYDEVVVAGKDLYDGKYIR